ncbi:hypothetical protein VTK73DRAFT_6725 [Phialemonium thermophilum]|uniref:Uncharacterized protein n=1 Tax=Phialemonium thermophilum TaxID=223376 RepID=A0ABR3XWE5_9PEZI
MPQPIFLRLRTLVPRQPSATLLSCRCSILLNLSISRPASFSDQKTRAQSTDRKPLGSNRQPPPSVPKATLRRVTSSALRGGFRNVRGAFSGTGLKATFEKNPGEFFIAIICLLGAAGAVVYATRLYYTYFYHEQFTRYPAPIAKSLRRALYFSNYKPDPQRALKYYKMALEQCDQFGLDPFSDDVLGIKIQLAAWLEKIGNYNNAAKVLETILTDCKRWVETMEETARDGATPSMLSRGSPTAVSSDRPLESTQSLSDETVPAESMWGKRTRILAKAIGISVKLGDLYADEHLMQNELAHGHLVWAVETALKESQRRAVEGLKDGEGEWMSAEAIGGALESLGHSYESRSQYHLAIPLFFQALRLSRDPCHSAVIMNNLAASFAQYPSQAPYQASAAADFTPSAELSPNAASPEDARRFNLESAFRWATNANFHATQTQGEQRTSECDQACAVSLCNLGDILAMLGNVEDARRKFEECIKLSRNIGFSPGVFQAEQGLRRLEATMANVSG